MPRTQTKTWNNVRPASRVSSEFFERDAGEVQRKFTFQVISMLSWE